MAPPRVVAFLSTGRCGTQWLTAGLRALHPDVVAEHEPIGALYAPRRHFRCYARPEAVLAEPAVAPHLEWIESLERPYVETGWPLFAALPLLAARFGERLRVVHLTRHPVPTALSHLVHNSFAGSDRDDEYTRLATLGPSDPNVFGAEYAARWERLSPYEKCLFWWTEVGLFGLELPEHLPSTALLRVQSEAMLGGEERVLQALLEFMGLEWHPGWLEHAGRQVDRWHHHTDRDVDPQQIHRHPRTLDLARRLGYDVDRVDVQALMSRYYGTPTSHLPGARR